MVFNSNVNTPVSYPRLLRRVRAVLIDSFLIIMVIFTWWLSLPLLENAPIAVKLAYPVIAWLVFDPLFVSRLGGTPGHLLVGLRVVNAGEPRSIGIVRAILRTLVKTITGWWSFILVLMTQRHQAIHDLLSHTVVILNNPDSFPCRERQKERKPDLKRFQYPSKTKRVVVILMYVVSSIFTYGILVALLITQTCLGGRQCTGIDTMVFFVLGYAWFFAVAAILVFGWWSLLYGARRRPLVNQT